MFHLVGGGVWIILDGNSFLIYFFGNKCIVYLLRSFLWNSLGINYSLNSQDSNSDLYY